ncbi:NAD(P)H-binding protein [Kribbella flavida]|nr:NAD(P)H-binding protein [Kribbella flavida]
MTILVLGATGKSGRRVVQRLRARGVEVRAGSRSAQTRFDWQDRGTWADAVQGVSAVYLVAPEETEVIEPFVSQAVAAGTGRFVVLSGRGLDQAAGTFGAGMAEAERAVRASGVDWTIVRANNFSQNFTEDLWAAPIEAGRLALPMAEVGEPFVDLEDLADLMAVLLTADGHAGRIYDASGPDALTFAEAAAVISRVAGRPIEYVEISPAQYAEELRAERYPDEAVQSLNAMFALMRAGHLATPADGVEQVLGRKPTPFTAYAERAFRGQG